MNIRNMQIWKKNRTVQIAQIYGTLVFLGLALYFLLMYAIGAVHIVELRALNLFIMFAGVYYSLRQYRRTHDGRMDYFRGLAVGTSTAFIGVTTFGFFLFFFLRFDTNLMESIRQNELIGPYLNPYIASCVVMVEGVFSGFGLTYLLSNYMNTNPATMPQGGEIPVTDKHGHSTTHRHSTTYAKTTRVVS